jgi:hypothetical protein
VQCFFCRFYLFPDTSGYLLRSRVSCELFVNLVKTQGSQTYNHHLVVRTPHYRHTTIISHEFSPNKSQRSVLPLYSTLKFGHPVKVCAFLRNRPSRLVTKRELASDIISKRNALPSNSLFKAPPSHQQIR